MENLPKLRGIASCNLKVTYPDLASPNTCGPGSAASAASFLVRPHPNAASTRSFDAPGTPPAQGKTQNAGSMGKTSLSRWTSGLGFHPRRLIFTQFPPRFRRPISVIPRPTCWTT